MKGKRGLSIGIALCAGMFALIFDSKTALTGAAAGVDLCLKSVIPSLFPFFVLTSMLTGMLTGSKLPLLASVGRLCGMPRGAESILIIGLLGGYPMGAKAVCEGYMGGQLSKSDAERMLGFCSNAGPAFVFGMVQGFFSSPFTAFLLWWIHIASAVAVSMILPRKDSQPAPIPAGLPITLPEALQRSITAMAAVCGWVVLFRVVIGFSEKWFLWLLPTSGQVFLLGILELTNGCLGLRSISDEGLRFLLASALLGFGGICVGMQTVSVTAGAKLSTGYYFPGKLLQCCISTALSIPVVRLLFPETKMMETPALLLTLVTFIIALLFLKSRKITVAFLAKLLYNEHQNVRKKG